MAESEIPAFWMWKILTDIIPAMDASINNVQRLITILHSSEFSDLFDYTWNEAIPLEQQEFILKKYKAFTVWLLGRFFYLLNQSQLSSTHHLIINAQERILYKILVTNPHIYDEITTEYTKVLKQLNSYHEKSIEEALVLKAFIPENVINSLDLSPLFITISNQQMCTHMQYITLKFIAHKMLFAYIKPEYCEILDQLLYILRSCSLKLKSAVLDMFRTNLWAYDDYPFEIKDYFKHMFSVYEQMFYRKIIHHDNFKDFEELTNDVLESEHFNKANLCRFILNERYTVSSDVYAICMGYVSSNCKKDFRMKRMMVVEEILNNNGESGTLNELFSEIEKRYSETECVNNCCLNDNLTFIKDVLDTAVTAKIRKLQQNNEHSQFFEETKFFPKLLDHVIRHVNNCETSLAFDDFASILTTMLMVSKVNNFKVMFQLLQNQQVADFKYIGCSDQFNVRKNLNILKSHLNGFDFEKLCYFQFVAVSGLCSGNFDADLGEFLNVAETLDDQTLSMIIPYLPVMFASNHQTETLCKEVYLRLLLSDNNGVLITVTEKLTEVLTILFAKCSIYIKHDDYISKLELAVNSGCFKLTDHDAQISEDVTRSIVQALFDLLERDEEIIRANVVEALPILSQNVLLFHKISVEKWMTFSEDESMRVRQAFFKVLCDIIDLDGCEELSTELKEDTLEAVFTILKKVCKQSLQHKPHWQMDLLDVIRSLSKLQNDTVASKIINLLIFFIMMPTSKTVFAAINIMNELPALHRTTKVKMYQKFRRDICKTVVNLCAVLQHFVNYPLSKSMQQISQVLGFQDYKHFIVEETRYLLPLFVGLVIKVPRVEDLMREMVCDNSDLADMIATGYGYIFLHVFLEDNDTQDLKKKMGYLERITGLSGTVLMMRNFMVILTGLLLSFHEKRERVISALTHLANEENPNMTIQNFIRPHFLGILQNFDLRLIDPNYSKRKVLLSLAQIFKFMGRTHISPFRLKIIAMLRTTLGTLQTELSCDIWATFVSSCDAEALGPHLTTICVSILPLLEVNSAKVNDILNYLVVENERFLKDFVADLYFVLDDEAVDRSVRDVIDASLRRIKDLNFKEHLEYFMKYLAHETNEVKIHALKYIKNLLKANREELDRIVLGYNGIDQSVVDLIDVVTVTCREQDAALRLACAECIGELGAIDPSHLPRRHAKEENTFNFLLTDPAFIITSLNELVRSLHAQKNTQNMDGISLAIQETLKTYRISPVSTSDGHEMWKSLSEMQQELIKPLLSSKYTMAQSVDDVIVHPIYGSSQGSNFKLWLYIWTVSLTMGLGSNKSLIQVYLPSMKQDQKIFMFFLPYILLHYLIENNMEDHKKVIAEFKAVIKSSEGGSNEGNLLSKLPLRTDNFISVSRTSQAEDFNKEGQHIKVVFVLMDFLDRWLREWEWERGYAGTEDAHYKKIKLFTTSFCKLQLAKCNYACGEYARALLYLEAYMLKNNSESDEHLSLLAELYHRLDEPDGVAGVQALRKGEPRLEERILALEVSGKLAEAASCYDSLPTPMNLFQIQGLMRCHLALGNINTALNLAKVTLETEMEYTHWMLEGQAEALWRLGRYEDLEQLLKKEELKANNCWGVQVGHALLNFRNGSRDDFKTNLSDLRVSQINQLAGASLEVGAYQHGYFYISRLHVLNEFEKIEALVHELLLRPNDANVCQNIMRQMKTEWDLRLKVVQSSVRIIEPMLCLRRVLLDLAKNFVENRVPNAGKLFDGILGEAWLKSAEIAVAAEIPQQAFSYLLKAEFYAPPKLFLEKAKLHWLKEEHEQALTTLKRGLANFFPVDNFVVNKPHTFTEEEMRLCAEAKLLIASYNDSVSNVDTNVNIQHYKQAVDMFKEWEKSLIYLAQYYDRIFQGYSEEDRDVKGSDIQIHMINFFGKSLQYGTTYVYQSMPRLLSIWFDYGTRLLDAEPSVREERRANLLKMTKLVDSFLTRLPTFVFLTAFSQIVSRICHPQREVYILLKNIIVKVIQHYPQQTLWMIITVIKSSYTLRSRRCGEILNDNDLKTPEMLKLLSDFTKLAEKLIELCNKEISKTLNVVSINSLLRSLPRLLAQGNFSEIMIPAHKFRKLVLPNPDFATGQQHNPFPNRYVHIVGIDDEMHILNSMQRPRKITFRGSDGKRYTQMLKPKDDLRKDFRLMEFNDIVNQMLSKDPESRQRRLNIRLYSVAPLNEECGLIEWVPNLVGLRPIVLTLYKQKGLGMRNTDLKNACCKQSDSLQKKREIFLKKLLPNFPPVLDEWFRKVFPDPQSWLTARTAYIRTTAVMSVVGFILGLGDRHGENISFDSTNGDTVHVDFNCLFNKGETLEWPERVPFRLTHNMVAAMGPLGVEGPFRKSCACTLRVLRTHTDTLMSIVTPFVYDPLVSWKGSLPSNSRAQVAERTNESARDEIKAIENRLQGQIKTRFRACSIPLSVEGQINNLIVEAMNVDNLCQMYIGWGGYL